MDLRSDGLALSHSHYIASFVQVEDLNGKVVIAAHGDGGGIHDAELFGKHLRIGDLRKHHGVRIFQWIAVIDAVNASGLGDNFGMDFQGPEGMHLTAPLELMLGPNAWHQVLVTGAVRVRSAAEHDEEGWFLRFTAGNASLEAAILCGPRPALHGDGWTFHAPVGPARLERKRNYFDSSEPWELLRSVEVESDSELVLVLP